MQTSVEGGTPIAPYSKRQKMCLRNRLCAYYDERSLSWDELTSLMGLEPEKNPEMHDEDEDNFSGADYYETVRKFTKGIKDRKTGKRTYPNVNAGNLTLIRDFLIAEGHLSKVGFQLLGKEYEAAHALAEFFCRSDQNLAHKKLEGTFDCETPLDDTGINHRILRLSLRSDLKFYSAEETRIRNDDYQVEETKEGRKVNVEKCLLHANNTIILNGWATVTSFDGVMIYLEDLGFGYQNSPQKHTVYTVCRLGYNSQGVKDIVLKSYTSNIFQPIQDPKRFNEEIEQKEEYNFIRCLENFLDELHIKANSSIDKLNESDLSDEANLFDSGTRLIRGNIDESKGEILEGIQREKENLSTGDGYLQENQSAGRDKDEMHAMNNELGKKFIQSLMDYDPHAIADCINADVDINYQDPETGMTALHLAVARQMVDVLKILFNREDLVYLVQDKNGKFPSQLAYEIVGNATLGERLMKRERQEAEAQELDYRELLEKGDQIFVEAAQRAKSLWSEPEPSK